MQLSIGSLDLINESKKFQGEIWKVKNKIKCQNKY